MDAKKRFQELALRAVYTGSAQFTHFLDPSEEEDVRMAARSAQAQVVLSGGYDGAERRMAAFYDAEPPERFPIAALALRWNPKFASAQHRDLLGAVMGLGLERDATGDICMGAEPGLAYLFCTEDVEGYIAASLESAGRASLKVTPAGEVRIAPPEGVQMRATVQNLRLDALLAAGFRLSRSEAQRLIAAGLVKLNHVPELRGDVRLEADDLISARGYGRLRVDEVQGETRKGRIAVALFRYGK